MSVNTAAAIILRPVQSGGTNSSSSKKLSQDIYQGTPQIGEDFYINRGFDDECASSLSSLSGGFTNINIIQFRHLEYDAENADGDSVEATSTVEQSDDAYGHKNTNTEDKSSLTLSSITYDFVGNGRFFTFGKLQKFEVQLGAFLIPMIVIVMTRVLQWKRRACQLVVLLRIVQNTFPCRMIQYNPLQAKANRMK